MQQLSFLEVGFKNVTVDENKETPFLVLTYYISSLLFAIFGIKMIYEAYHMSANEGQEEFEEVNEELRKREEKESRGDIESGGHGGEVTAFSMLSKIFIQAFTMTTLAEWGDRS